MYIHFQQLSHLIHTWCMHSLLKSVRSHMNYNTLYYPDSNILYRKGLNIQHKSNHTHYTLPLFCILLLIFSFLLNICLNLEEIQLHTTNKNIFNSLHIKNNLIDNCNIYFPHDTFHNYTIHIIVWLIINFRLCILLSFYK